MSKSDGVGGDEIAKAVKLRDMAEARKDGGAGVKAMKTARMRVEQARRGA